MRSLLFVPGDRPEKFSKAHASGADALIFDLEDSVSHNHKDFGRKSIAEALKQPRTGTKLFVRVNPLDSEYINDDLASLNGLNFDGIVLPKSNGASSVNSLLKLMAENNINTKILPIAAESPGAVFQLGSHQDVSEYLVGLTWGAEDLHASIGTDSCRNFFGRYKSPYEVVSSLTLFAAHAAGVEAIETVYPDFRDLEGFRAYATRSATNGFTGMLAIHPTQVSIINEAFTINADDIDRAREIVAAFEANPGAIQIDGQMYGAPHYKQSKKLLKRVDG